MMMMGGMIWMFLGFLLFLAVIVAVIWLLVRAFRAPRMSMTPPQYQQQAPPPVPGPQTYEEGGSAHPYPEQPSATYPQTPQEQQEQRPRF
jgi:predicted lipid-binding transport protein (Tim44 family)